MAKMFSCMPPGNEHADLKVFNGSFDNGAYLIRAVPFFRIPLDIRKHPQFHIFVGIRSPALSPYEPLNSSKGKQIKTITKKKGRCIIMGKNEKYCSKVRGYIKEWVFHESLERLVAAFGGTVNPRESLEDRVKRLAAFSKRWDYRRQKDAHDSQTGENARWLIEADLSIKQELLVKKAAGDLGLIGKEIPQEKKFDYILVLGGARMSCLNRTKYARELCEKHGIRAGQIICLTGMRPLLETEKDVTDTYAPSAETEFDLMEAAVKQIFGELPELSREEHKEDVNRSHAVVEYGGTWQVSIMAAPSLEPDKRRANTADTLLYFANRQNIGMDKKILMITSQIYVPYQQMEAWRTLGIPQGHSVETVGFPAGWSVGLPGLQEPKNYLQEMRSVLLAMDKAMKEMQNGDKKTVKDKSELIIGVQKHYEEMPREEMWEIVSWIEKYYQYENSGRALQTMIGLPGAGKSVLLRMAVNYMRKYQEYFNGFICHIDISDCADEIGVYFKIARELQAYYHNYSDAPKQEKRQKKALEQFLEMHQWLYGKAGEYPANVSLKEDAADAVKQAAELVKQSMETFLTEHTQEDSEGGGGRWNDYLEIACGLLSKVTGLIPYGDGFKMVAKLVAEGKEQQRIKRLLQDTVDAFTSPSRREEIFRRLLLVALPQRGHGTQLNPVIILDNFQTAQAGELGRDHTWLSRPGRLMAVADALWIIAGRDSTVNYFRNVFEEALAGHEYVLQGFSSDTAKEYLEGRCREILEERGLDREVPADVVEKMMSVCAMAGHDFVGNREVDERQKFYLPYLLNLVTIHFRRLCEDPASTITPDAFVGLQEKEEFIGYYFYKDLSDLMTNAFQILCCLSTWDDKWIEIVRNQFDNHLLNAKNLLFKTAPMEWIGEGHFKLHEAVRDGLYNNSRNYIKQDVLNYLFDEFLRIYGSDEAKNQKEIWYQPERLQTFLEVVYKYIKQSQQREESIEKVKTVMKKIYGHNSGRGYVTDGFIRIYSGYVDQMRNFYKIPFITVLNESFGNMDQLRQELSNAFVDCGFDFPDIRKAIYVMQCCFDLADLYTNLNMSGEARKLEGLCLQFWEYMESFAAGETEARPVDQVARWECRRRRIKAMNAIAYDSSQEHDYSMAYQYGTEGLKLFGVSMQEMARLLVVPDEVKLIISPEETDEFAINSCMEVSNELYGRLKKGYAVLFDWSTDQAGQDTEKTKLQIILAEMLLEEQQNLRGNYPWYCIKTGSSQLSGEERCMYGARTYWMRKARLEAAETDERKEIVKNLFDYRRKMLISYHNICVYLYKAGESRTACILEGEVIAQSRKILPPRKLTDQAEARISEILDQPDNGKNEQKSNEFLSYLWKLENGADNAMEKWTEADQILEEIQYMGDYYLHMDFYAFAMRQLSHVALSRYIRFGAMDNRTLDSFLRLYVAAFATQDQKMTKAMAEYMQGVWTEHAKELKGDHVKSLADKMESMKQMILMSGSQQCDRNKIVRLMLAEVD